MSGSNWDSSRSSSSWPPRWRSCAAAGRRRTSGSSSAARPWSSRRAATGSSRGCFSEGDDEADRNPGDDRSPAGLAAAAPARAGRCRAIGATEKVSDNVYKIFGAGGNTTFFVRSDGVVLVDTKLANNGAGILAKVREVTDKPVTMIINTHSHPDHLGTNTEIDTARGGVAGRGPGQHRQAHGGDADATPRSRQSFEDRLTLGSGARPDRPLLVRPGAHRRRRLHRLPGGEGAADGRRDGVGHGPADRSDVGRQHGRHPGHRRPAGRRPSPASTRWSKATAT